MESTNTMNKIEFSEAVKRYLNRGWLINETSNGTVIQFYMPDDSGKPIGLMEISIDNGVRIKTPSRNWVWSEWQEYNNLTACL